MAPFDLPLGRYLVCVQFHTRFATNVYPYLASLLNPGADTPLQILWHKSKSSHRTVIPLSDVMHIYRPRLRSIVSRTDPGKTLWHSRSPALSRSSQYVEFPRTKLCSTRRLLFPAFKDMPKVILPKILPDDGNFIFGGLAFLNFWRHRHSFAAGLERQKSSFNMHCYVRAMVVAILIVIWAPPSLSWSTCWPLRKEYSLTRPGRTYTLTSGMWRKSR
ncbi:hypothetical protein K438DRAFT_1970934 [Mycena galopus ATCC 62051]|nr:hypothetical protein K438DRAFT_1970934 [Mycena galopus ATCC 62051]